MHLTKYRTLPGRSDYQVGDDGSVWSKVKGGEWKQLKPFQDPKTKRLQVYLYPGRVLKRVHTLVLEAFVGKRPKGMGARHFPDRDPTNNRLSNLQWSTQKENQNDCVVHGTRIQGEKSHLSKLTAKKVRAIRAEYSGVRGDLSRLAKKYKTRTTNIQQIVTGKTWKHLVN